jgi:glycosyltransferase involved in cell wall biosynthesis
MFGSDREMTARGEREPLSILLLTPIGGDNWGGVERWMVDLAEHALARGHRVVACGKPGSRWLETCVERGFPSTGLRMRGDFNPRDVWTLRRLYREHGVDLVAVKLQQCIRMAWAARLVMGSAGPAIFCHAGDTFMKRSARARFTHGRMVDGYVAPADFTRDELLHYGYFGPEKIRAIHNGVPIPTDDPAAGERVRAELELGDAVVLTVTSRLHEMKGHRFLLEALAELRADFPRARLLIVGDGGERPNIEARIAELGLADVVTLTGFRNDVLDVLRATDVFVLPSLLEGLPFTGLEAMATGLPVVASNIDGLPEAVIHGLTGLLVPPSDAAALRNALARLLGDPALARKMGSAGRERVRMRFDPERLLDVTLDYCLELRAARQGR